MDKKRKSWTIKQSMLAICFIGSIMILIVSAFGLTGLNLVKYDSQQIAETYVPEWTIANAIENEIREIGYDKLKYKISLNEKIYHDIERKHAIIENLMHNLNEIAVLNNIESLKKNISNLKFNSLNLKEKLEIFHNKSIEYHIFEDSVEHIITDFTKDLEYLMLKTSGDETYFLTKILEKEIDTSLKLWKSLARENIDGIIEGRKSFSDIKSVFQSRVKEVDVDKSEKYEPLILKLAKVVDLLDILIEIEQSIIVNEKEIDVFFNNSIKYAHSISDSASTRTSEFSKHAVASVESFWSLILIVDVITVLLSIIIGYYLAKRINKKLSLAVLRIKSSSNEVNVAATQFAGTSQNLAQRSSEQAASIEEATSSIEEINSQIKQNSENSLVAELTMEESKTNVENSVSVIETLKNAMKEIQHSSTETSKIIKTIDDIAFQTNLLALNAAVEAARAGDAGKGFAVVAEEVRNLARRSADAAKDTAQLINSSQNSSQNGVESAQRVMEALELISESTKKADVMIKEIAASSKEQATGIEQLTSVMNVMDKSIQDNASSSEESASGAEELAAQSQEMNTIVGEISMLVGLNINESLYQALQTQDEVLQHKKNEISKNKASSSLLTKNGFHQISPSNLGIEQPINRSSEKKSYEFIPFEDDFNEF